MSDLISRQAVLDILSLKNSAWDAYSKVVDLPSAQSEQKTGHWIVEQNALGNDYTVCSVCETVVKLKVYNKPLAEIDMREAHFCPNCGAKMVANDT